MAGRLSTICAVLSIALLIYAVSVVLIGRQINRKLINISMTRGTPPPPMRPPDSRINLFGARVPLAIVWLVGSGGPTLWVALSVRRRLTRLGRERRGQCLDCGHHLTARSGRCPGCRAWYER